MATFRQKGHSSPDSITKETPAQKLQKQEHDYENNLHHVTVTYQAKQEQRQTWIQHRGLCRSAHHWECTHCLFYSLRDDFLLKTD